MRISCSSPTTALSSARRFPAFLRTGRNTQGVRIMRVEEGSQVVCVAPAEAEEDEEGEAELPPLEDAEELSAETDETDETEAQPEGEDDDI